MKYDVDKKEIEVENFVVIDKCKAEVEIKLENSAFEKIVVEGDGSIKGRCAELVQNALHSKYGQPAGDRETASAKLFRKYSLTTWNRDGVTLIFKNFSHAGSRGLGWKSWELTYEPQASDVGL